MKIPLALLALLSICGLSSCDRESSQSPPQRRDSDVNAQSSSQTPSPDENRQTPTATAQDPVVSLKKLAASVPPEQFSLDQKDMEDFRKDDHEVYNPAVYGLRKYSYRVVDMDAQKTDSMMKPYTGHLDIACHVASNDGQFESNTWRLLLDWESGRWVLKGLMSSNRDGTYDFSQNPKHPETKLIRRIVARLAWE